MRYINYNNTKDFYTINEVCYLFEIDKSELRRYAENVATLRKSSELYAAFELKQDFAAPLQQFGLRASDSPIRHFLRDYNQIGEISTNVAAAPALVC